MSLKARCWLLLRHRFATRLDSDDGRQMDDVRRDTRKENYHSFDDVHRVERRLPQGRLSSFLSRRPPNVTRSSVSPSAPTCGKS